MENNRSIKFASAFTEGGALYAFAKKVMDEEELELCFRGNDNAVNIYFNNLLVWKIYSMRSGFKVEVSLHKSITPNTRKEIADKLKNELGFDSLYENKEIKRYPSIKKQAVNSEFVNKTYDVIRPMLNEYFEGGKHKEKLRQQELFRSLDDYQKHHGLYVYDLELQDKGESKKGQNLSDMIAVRYESGKANSLALVEVKSTKIACYDIKSGIKPHLKAMWKYINDSNKMVEKKKEAFDLITQYKELKVRKTPDDIKSIKEIDKYEVIMILTDDAKTFYEKMKEEINDYIEGEKIKCVFYKWENKQLEVID
ncbi:MAG: hypothetical protein K6A29_05175 [Lachnospiraceae bacterium]|nr:hypothetical protein [Lachnospiraceae bacterium]